MSGQDRSLLIEVADSAGYCWGVERAIDLATEAAESNPSKDVNTLGPVIHNTRTVNRLKDDYDIGILDEADTAVDGDVMVIRAHGVPEAVIEDARERGVEVVDGTCPLVTVIHRAARRLEAEGYNVVIIGKRDHPEIIGIQGAIEGPGHVLETPDDVADLPPMKKCGVVLQSTIIAAHAGDIIGRLGARYRYLKVENTICHVTTERQTETGDLAARVEVMLVVGSPHSSNTRKLEQVCIEAGCTTYRIEVPGDIDMSWFDGVHHIGVHAGASTPRELLGEITDHLYGSLVSD